VCWWCYQVPRALNPAGLRFDHTNWQELLGRRQYFRELCRVFRDELQRCATTGQESLQAQCAVLSSGDANRLKRAAPPIFGWVVREHLPLLMQGAAGGYFHGLVSAAIACINAAIPTYGKPEVVADALAYAAYRYDSASVPTTSCVARRVAAYVTTVR
jgi:hypothetical protein